MLGVVFEGCACRAAFHAGVAEALVTAGLPIGITAGASSGAIIAAAVAAGQGAALTDLWQRTSGRSIVSWRRAAHNRSIFDMSTIVRDALRESLGAGDLRTAPLEALCTVTRLRDMQTLVRSSRDELDFVNAVLGSCFFPVIYGRTIRVDGSVVVDGGISDNLPVRALVERGATTVLAVVPAYDGTALLRPLKPRARPETLSSEGVRVVTIKPSRPLAVRAWDLDRDRVKAAIAEGREAGLRALDLL